MRIFYIWMYNYLWLVFSFFLIWINVYIYIIGINCLNVTFCDLRWNKLITVQNYNVFFRQILLLINGGGGGGIL